MATLPNSLLRQQAFINGNWTDAHDSTTYPVINPYNQSILAFVPNMGESETNQAIEAAQAAFEDWKNQTSHDRAQLLKKWYELQMAHLEELATLLTLEQGKPLAEARSEIKYGASFIEWFAEEGKRTYGDVIPSPTPHTRIITIKQPIGVVAAITPWNFPHAMIARKIAPALSAGCTVVVKPAEDTPLTALALAVLAEKAGIPKGVLNIVTTNAPEKVGAALTRHPLVRKLSFTGSTEIGKLLMRQCADTVKKISLELGGNAPFIVFDDADLSAAVEGAIASKFRNAGQTCVCTNRIYVQRAVYQEFVAQFTKAVQQQKMGDGMENSTTIGPLINEAALEKVEALLSDALLKGAILQTGGKRAVENNAFFEPTVLSNAKAGMAISKEEVFGPVAPVYVFDTEAEVIKLANDTPYGLAAYFYGNNVARVWRVAEALEYGMVGINTGFISNAVAPFGGVKESGIGREGSKYGIEEYLEIKYLCFGGM